MSGATIAGRRAAASGRARRAARPRSCCPTGSGSTTVSRSSTSSPSARRPRWRAGRRRCLAARPGTAPAGGDARRGGRGRAGRGRRRPDGQRSQATAPHRAGTTEITILAANVLHGRADPGALTTLIERSAPDFVVLPEAGPDFRDKLMPPLEILGYRSWVSTEPGTVDGRSVTLLAGPRAGDLRVRAASAMHLAHLEATGGLLGGRTLYAVHPMAPVGAGPPRAGGATWPCSAAGARPPRRRSWSAT